MEQLYRLCNFISDMFSSGHCVDSVINEQNVNEQEVKPKKIKINRNIAKHDKINFTRQRKFKPVKFYKNNY